MQQAHANTHGHTATLPAKYLYRRVIFVSRTRASLIIIHAAAEEQARTPRPPSLTDGVLDPELLPLSTEFSSFHYSAAGCLICRGLRTFTPLHPFLS